MIIANDGLLGGAEVESDAEILATWGDSLSRRDKVQFGSVADMSSIELADRTGVIGGGPSKPLPIRPDAIVSPDRPPLKMPPRADRFDCLERLAQSCRHTLTGQTVRASPRRCLAGSASHDREWRVFKIMVRYRHSITRLKAGP